jgi:hypothetical protein
MVHLVKQKRSLDDTWQALERAKAGKLLWVRSHSKEKPAGRARLVEEVEEGERRQAAWPYRRMWLRDNAAASTRYAPQPLAPKEAPAGCALAESACVYGCDGIRRRCS